MFDATRYVIWCTARNRLRARLRRLREPRYLIGAAVGLGYLFITLGIRQRLFQPRGARRPSRNPSADAASVTAAFNVVGPALGGVALAGLSLAAWILPFGSNLLSFSQAETALLVSAPLTRRQLVLYRMMRSQAAVLAGALIMALAYPTGSLFGRLRGLVGVWLLLTTSHVFATIVTLARAHIRQGKGLPRFAWPALAISVAALWGVVLPLTSTASAALTTDGATLIEAVTTLAGQRPTYFFLLPFTSMVRPFFAGGAIEFVVAFASAFAVYLVAVLWLVWADSCSPDIADASIDRQSGLPPRREHAYQRREVAWRLAPTGRVEMVFMWKAALRTLRAIDGSTVVRLLILLLALGVAIQFATRARELVILMGAFCTLGALFTTLMAPQLIRMDLREDLAHLVWLRAWPVRGVAVLRGEILWPALVVTLVAWVFGATALVLSLASQSRIPLASRTAVWLAFLLLIPGVVLAQYTIHNAIAVIFPGWIPLGASRPRGVDAAGQRMIVLAASWGAMLVALVPGVAVTAALSWLMRPLVGAWALPAGALVTTLCVIGEMVLVTRALGPVYERLDVTSTERPD